MRTTGDGKFFPAGSLVTVDGRASIRTTREILDNGLPPESVAHLFKPQPRRKLKIRVKRKR